MHIGKTNVKSQSTNEIIVLLDSGSSRHITNNRNILHNYKNLHPASAPVF